MLCALHESGWDNLSIAESQRAYAVHVLHNWPQVLSMNEFGFDNLNAKEAPVLVYVASSTGDGDSPDNSAK